MTSLRLSNSDRPSEDKGFCLEEWVQGLCLETCSLWLGASAMPVPSQCLWDKTYLLGRDETQPWNSQGEPDTVRRLRVVGQRPDGTKEIDAESSQDCSSCGLDSKSCLDSDGPQNSCQTLAVHLGKTPQRVDEVACGVNTIKLNLVRSSHRLSGSQQCFPWKLCLWLT